MRERDAAVGSMKRAMDIVLAAVALVLLSPIMAIGAGLVRWRLDRPVLFRQVRPGLHGRPFHLIRFRTMTDGRDVRRPNAFPN